MLRTAAIEARSGSMMAAPAAPLEECWYALRTLKGLDNVTLLLSGQGTSWRGGKAVTTLTGTDLAAALNEGAEEAWSERYDCAYYRSGAATVWYLNKTAAAERLELLRLMGGGSFALTGTEDAYSGTLAGSEL